MMNTREAIIVFKQHVMNKIIPQGYGVEFSDLPDEELEKLIELAHLVMEKRSQETLITKERAEFLERVSKAMETVMQEEN